MCPVRTITLKPCGLCRDNYWKTAEEEAVLDKLSCWQRADTAREMLQAIAKEIGRNTSSETGFCSRTQYSALPLPRGQEDLRLDPSTRTRPSCKRAEALNRGGGWVERKRGGKMETQCKFKSLTVSSCCTQNKPAKLPRCLPFSQDSRNNIRLERVKSQNVESWAKACHKIWSSFDGYLKCERQWSQIFKHGCMRKDVAVFSD